MIVCLAGMGRSGTSLMSSYLQHCGVPMGERQVGARFNNPRGHFEDQDFLDLHKDILRHNRIDMYSPKQDLSFADQHYEQAQTMITHRNEQYSEWGWKEPRTTLFLDFWGELLPDAKFIFMYRDPYSNMESLYRIINKHYIYLTPWVVPGAWLFYNRRCLDFHSKHPERSIFLSIDGFNANHEDSTVMLSRWLGRKLNKPYTDVYRPHEMSCGTSVSRHFPANIYVPLFRKIYGLEIANVLKQMDEIALIRNNQS